MCATITALGRLYVLRFAVMFVFYFRYECFDFVWCCFIWV